MANFNSKRNPSQLSPRASQLHRSVLESFNENDRDKFTEILARYQQNKSVQRLVESLDQICNTTQQREEIYPLVRSFIPRKHRERFDYECNRPRSAYGRHYATYSKKHIPKNGYYTTRSLPGDIRNRQSGSSLGVERRIPTPVTPPHRTPKPPRDRKESNARTVVLDREDEEESFGFCIRGGSEYNIGLFVSSVDEDSPAHNAGICLGDQILEVNGVDFRNVSHQEAVKVIQRSHILRMLVKSVGKIPGSFKSSSSYRWIDPRGNEVSPPQQYASIMNGDKSEMRLLGADDERKVNLFVADGAEIGLKIRGGMEHGLGIFIASVERNSGADRAGIQVGDQILDVNGKCFPNISHEEAVRVLKSSQQLVIMLKDVGILPHGKRVYDETRWITDTESKNTSRPSSSGSSDKKSTSMKKTPSFYNPMGSSQLTHHSVLDHSDEILEMKARQSLPDDDLHAFAFYLNEYRTARLSLTSFFNVLLDLLNTPEKVLLFQEIRSAILPRDLTKFDEWIEQIEHTRIKRHDTDGSQTKHDKLSLYSYKSSDSSATTNSWLGLFENGDEKHSRTKFKYRHQQDALPHPPKDFLDDSLNSGSETREFGTRPRDPSFDQLPPPSPVFALNSMGTYGNINRFEQASCQIGLNANNTPFYRKSSDKTTEISRDRDGHFPISVDYRGVDEKCMSKDKYPLEDSTYDDDGLYTPVDYKGPKRATGSAVDNFTMLSAGGAEDDLYTSVDNMEFDMKYKSVSSTSRDNDLKSNGFIDEETEIPVYAAVDKTRISPKMAKKNFPLDSEFEIPPPIPDRLFLETGDSQEGSDNTDNIHSEQSTHDFRNNTSLRHEQSFLPLQTGQIKDRIESTTNGVIEMNIASFPERLQTFNGESSAGQKHKNGIVQKSKKVKKKSKSKVVEVEEPVDHDGQPFVVELTKHSSNLGLSVSGGTDTDSKEIRIKSVKDEDTVAGSCPLLQPGQIILGVDEKSLQNVTSGIAAMAIRQAFHSDKTVLKLILQNSR